MLRDQGCRLLISGHKLENLTKPCRSGALAAVARAEEYSISCTGFWHNFSGVSPLIISLLLSELSVCWVDETAFPIRRVKAVWSDAEITVDYRNAGFEASFLVG